MDPRISTRWVRPKYEGEKNEGKELVDKAAYVSAEVRINALMRAGRDLVQWRRDQFDAGPYDEDYEPDIDPTRNPGSDITDIQAYGKNLKQRMEARRAQREKEQFDREQQKASKSAAGADGGPAGAAPAGNS